MKRKSMRHVVLASALLLCTTLPACETDASKTKAMTGVWTWKPRAELPKDKVVDKGFPTPEMETIDLRADGTFVHVEQIPGYETDVAGKPFHVSERWEERTGTWSYAKGELSLGPATAANRWGASHDGDKGWVSETLASEGDRTFKVVELTKANLQLHDLAIGGYDRSLHRANAMPQRPAGSGLK